MLAGTLFFLGLGHRFRLADTLRSQSSFWESLIRPIAAVALPLLIPRFPPPLAEVSITNSSRALPCAGKWTRFTPIFLAQDKMICEFQPASSSDFELQANGRASNSGLAGIEKLKPRKSELAEFAVGKIAAIT